MMKFGIFDHVMGRPDAGPHSTLEEHLEQVEEADGLNFDYYFVAEHHARGEFNTTPSPNCFISAASQRTRRIRLGPLVLMVPLYHPIRILEEISMMDQLTNGRLEVGIGYGTGPRELRPYGVDPEKKLAMMLEAIAMLKKIWKEGGVDHEGEFYRSLNSGLPVPTTIQKPHPPLWYPCNSVGPIPWAAENNMAVPALTTFEDYRSRLRGMFDLYKSKWRSSPEFPNRPPLAFSSVIYVGETDSEARREAIEDIRRFWRIWSDTSSKKNVNPELKSRLSSLVDYDYDDDTEGRIIVGSSKTVASHLSSIFRDTGADCFLGEFAFGYLPHKKVLKSLKLFSDEVVPTLLDETSIGR